MIGYCVTPMPELASYRLRVQIPSRHLTVPYAIGCTGKPTFFYKNGNPRLAESLTGGVVYDVVNDHFRGKNAADYHAMCSIADVITVGSETMAETVREHTGRDATVISDPYENDEQDAKCEGEVVLWFGHSANLQSLVPHIETPNLRICSNVPKAVPWSLKSERIELDKCAVVLLTGSSAGASPNRVVKAIRAGRFVVMPADSPQSWGQFAPYVWIGDVREGIRWALNNREEACNNIRLGQKYTQETFTPSLISAQWMELFDSI
jgi:hypothetical protein